MARFDEILYHSPRVPSVDEIESLLRKALVVLTPEQLWVNPDCGLKTRLPFAAVR
jgi:5-methyltetrahydropteroyltriglutamate--homocysteine methyltransferase